MFTLTSHFKFYVIINPTMNNSDGDNQDDVSAEYTMTHLSILTKGSVRCEDKTSAKVEHKIVFGLFRLSAEVARGSSPPRVVPYF